MENPLSFQNVFTVRLYVFVYLDCVHYEIKTKQLINFISVLKPNLQIWKLSKEYIKFSLQTDNFQIQNYFMMFLNRSTKCTFKRFKKYSLLIFEI